MTFTDEQMLEAIQGNKSVKECFKNISEVCKELQSKTGCPDDDIDRFLEFTVGKWQNIDRVI